VVAQQELATIPAGGTAAVPFTVAFSSAGEYLIQARIPGDSLDADNVRSINISVRETLPVLLVEGKPDAEGREQATSWLADALHPFLDNARRPMFPVRPKTINLAEFANPADGDLRPYDAVFLCDVPRLREREVARLETHLQRGGGLVIALGPSVDFENYNRLLFQDGQGPLPGKLAGIVRAPDDQHFQLAAEADAFRQAPLDAFAADNDRAALLGARIRQFVRIEPSPGAAARKVLTFVPPPGITGEDARQVLAAPFLLERPRHRGRVALFASTLNAEWTSWPIAPSFLPFVQELVRAVVRPSLCRTYGRGRRAAGRMAAGERVPTGSQGPDAGWTE
jgi:hypothetical protein